MGMGRGAVWAWGGLIEISHLLMLQSFHFFLIVTHILRQTGSHCTSSALALSTLFLDPGLNTRHTRGLYSPHACVGELKTWP